MIMKTKHRILSVVIAAVILTALILPCGTTALAAEYPRFIDYEGLLTESQERQLNDKLDEISERRRFDTVVVVVHSIYGVEARLAAADFFEQNGYGYGRDIDGAILLLSMEGRDFGFATFGYGIQVFTSAGQDYLDTFFLPHLRTNDYFEAFMAFADAVDAFLKKAESGKPYDSGNIPMTSEERSTARVVTIIISLVAGLLTALIITGIWRRKLKSVRKQNLANEYVRQGSMHLTAQHDIFLHRQVSKVRRSTDNGGGGGGSRSFSSSSGRSSSGHSGKF